MGYTKEYAEDKKRRTGEYPAGYIPEVPATPTAKVATPPATPQPTRTPQQTDALVQSITAKRKALQALATPAPPAYPRYDPRTYGPQPLPTPASAPQIDHYAIVNPMAQYLSPVQQELDKRLTDAAFESLSVKGKKNPTLADVQAERRNLQAMSQMQVEKQALAAKQADVMGPRTTPPANLLPLPTTAEMQAHIDAMRRIQAQGGTTSSANVDTVRAPTPAESAAMARAPLATPSVLNTMMAEAKVNGMIVGPGNPSDPANWRTPAWQQNEANAAAFANAIPIIGPLAANIRTNQNDVVLNPRYKADWWAGPLGTAVSLPAYAVGFGAVANPVESAVASRIGGGIVAKAVGSAAALGTLGAANQVAAGLGQRTGQGVPVRMGDGTIIHIMPSAGDIASSSGKAFLSNAVIGAAFPVAAELGGVAGGSVNASPFAQTVIAKGVAGATMAAIGAVHGGWTEAGLLGALGAIGARPFESGPKGPFYISQVWDANGERLVVDRLPNGNYVVRAPKETSTPAESPVVPEPLRALPAPGESSPSSVVQEPVPTLPVASTAAGVGADVSPVTVTPVVTPVASVTHVTDHRTAPVSMPAPAVAPQTIVTQESPVAPETPAVEAVTAKTEVKFAGSLKSNTHRTATIELSNGEKYKGLLSYAAQHGWRITPVGKSPDVSYKKSGNFDTIEQAEKFLVDRANAKNTSGIPVVPTPAVEASTTKTVPTKVTAQEFLDANRALDAAKEERIRWQTTSTSRGEQRMKEEVDINASVERAQQHLADVYDRNNAYESSIPARNSTIPVSPKVDERQQLAESYASGKETLDGLLEHSKSRRLSESENADLGSYMEEVKARKKALDDWDKANQPKPRVTGSMNPLVKGQPESWTFTVDGKEYTATKLKAGYQVRPKDGAPELVKPSERFATPADVKAALEKAVVPVADNATTPVVSETPAPVEPVGAGQGNVPAAPVESSIAKTYADILDEHWAAQQEVDDAEAAVEKAKSQVAKERTQERLRIAEIALEKAERNYSVADKARGEALAQRPVEEVAAVRKAIDDARVAANNAEKEWRLKDKGKDKQAAESARIKSSELMQKFWSLKGAEDKWGYDAQVPIPPESPVAPPAQEVAQSPTPATETPVAGGALATTNTVARPDISGGGSGGSMAAGVKYAPAKKTPTGKFRQLARPVAPIEVKDWGTDPFNSVEQRTESVAAPADPLTPDEVPLPDLSARKEMSRMALEAATAGEHILQRTLLAKLDATKLPGGREAAAIVRAENASAQHQYDQYARQLDRHIRALNKLDIRDILASMDAYEKGKIEQAHPVFQDFVKTYEALDAVLVAQVQAAARAVGKEALANPLAFYIARQWKNVANMQTILDALMEGRRPIRGEEEVLVKKIIHDYNRLTMKERKLLQEDKPGERIALVKQGLNDLSKLLGGDRDLYTMFRDYMERTHGGPADGFLTRLSGRKLPTRASSLLQRHIPFFSQAVEYGLEPLTFNPAEATLLHIRELLTVKKTWRVLAQMKADGLMKFEPLGEIANRPKNWEPLPTAMGEVWMSSDQYVKEYFDANLIDDLTKFAERIGVHLTRKVRIGGSRLGYYQGTGGSGSKIVTRFGTPLSVLAHEIGHAIDAPDQRTALFGNPNFPKSDMILKAQLRKATAAGNASQVKAIQRLLTLNKELRAVADLHFEGRTASAGFKKYVRQTSEKMATVLESYLYAPERLKEVAPTVFENFEAYLKGNAKLKPLTEMRKSLVYGERMELIKGAGPQLVGHYIGPSGTVQLLANFTSSGWRGQGWYKAAMWASRIMIRLQLLNPTYHVGFTTTESMTNMLTQSIYALGRGNLKEAGKNAAMWATGVGPIIQNVVLGDRLIRAWTAENMSALPEDIRTTLQAFMDAGGRPFMAREYGGEARGQFRSRAALIRHAKSLGYGSRVALESLKQIPTGLEAVAEIITAPVMEWLVPRVKAGCFVFMYESEKRMLEKEGRLEELPEAARRIWDSIDNRFGQIAYDNMFCDQVVKDASFLIFRAFGFNFGTWREIGGGVSDALKSGGRGTAIGVRAATSWGQESPQEEAARLGTPPPPHEPWMSQRMAYVMALTLQTAIVGAFVTYLLTHRKPKSMTDYVLPPTGRTLPGGRPERLKLYGYAPDVYSTITDVTDTLHDTARTGTFKLHADTLVNKVNPLFGAVATGITNTDYEGIEVRDPHDPPPDQVRQWLTYGALPSIEPFSLSSYRRMVSMGIPPQEAGDRSLISIPPAAARIEDTDAIKLYRELTAKSPNAEGMPRERSAAYQALNALEQAIRSGADTSTVSQLAQNAIRPEVGATPYQVQSVQRSALVDPWVARLKYGAGAQAFGAPNIQNLLDLYATMNDEEKTAVKTLVEDRLYNALNDVNRIPADHRARIEQQAAKLKLITTPGGKIVPTVGGPKRPTLATPRP